MRMLSTQGLASASARHPWRTIGAWIAVSVLAIAAIAVLLPGSLTTEGAPTNNPESDRALVAQERAFPLDPDAAVTDLVVVRSERYTVDSPQFEDFVRALVADGEGTQLADARSYLTDASGSLVSPDRHATLLQLGIFDEAETEPVIEVVERADAHA